MINLSLHEIKQIAEIRGVNDYENKSEEDLIRILSKPRPITSPPKKKIKKIEKRELRHKFSKSEISKFRKKFHNIKTQRSLSAPEIRVIERSLIELEESLKSRRDLPRSKKQLIDLLRSPFAYNEVGNIFAYNKELGDNSVLWHHSDIPEDLWVIGTNDIAFEMSNAANFRPISVDPTFNFGVFDVTSFTFRSFMVQCKSKNVAQKWVSATMIGPTIIQHSKTADTYETSIRSIAKKCKLENTSDMLVKTDREPALITAILNIFKKCTLFRCTRHSENHCKDCLKQIGIHGSMKDVMLDVVFGENGLVEAENKFDF